MRKTPEAVRRAGSHFLPRSSPWIRRLVEAAELQPGEVVLDAGAGAGSITAALAAAVAPGGKVVAVENHPDAAAALRRLRLAGVEVVEGDVLRVRLPTPLDGVVANPPFRILPALLRRLLAHGFGRGAFVMPAELADRLEATPRSEAYGRLTVEVGLRAKVRRLFDIPPGAFDPPPAVACCAVHVAPKPGPPPADELGPVLDAAWSAKRRTIRHSLAPLAQGLGIPPQDVTAVLEATSTSARTAAEVSPWEYGQVARLLAEARIARSAHHNRAPVRGKAAPPGKGPSQNV